MIEKDITIIIGLMSGTSLDGLDIAACSFSDTPEGLKWQLLAAETVNYDPSWRKKLASLPFASAFDYALASVELGRYMGEQVKVFCAKRSLIPDYVASHGHTVFHRPDLALTTQIGDGDALAAACGLPVIFNFRTLDVALGGQGAPLVPIGDRLLFSSYDACLNLGGIANISYGKDERTAFDISPCNMLLNFLARKGGKDYDDGGLLARQGTVIPSLLNKLDSLDYYSRPLPKSLGREWFDAECLPLVENSLSGSSLHDVMRTAVEHIARQIAAVLNKNGLLTLLATGGGAKNTFLIERLQFLAPDCQVTVPSPDIVDFKEAIIFALLGYLRLCRRPNCLASVTGARQDNIGGQLSGLPPRS